MSHDDDRIWLDALAGRASAGGSAVAHEAQRLRTRILGRPIGDVPSVPVEDPAREEQLIERARLSGLLPRPAQAGGGASRASFGVWLSGWRMAAATIAVAGLALAVGIVMQERPRPEALRSAPTGVVRLEAHDPLALQRELLSALAAVGVAATGYERLGVLGIDADLPSPVPPELERVLERYGLAVPADGVLEVEIALQAGG